MIIAKMKRRSKCPVCGFNVTLNVRGEVPTHFAYGGYIKAVECTGSRAKSNSVNKGKN